MIRAVVGLGSNVGDRIGMLRAAVRKLPDVVAHSKVYETAPVGPFQADYLNAAVRIETALEPRALFEMMLSIERDLGRVRRERWGPRTIDLDLLWIEGRIVNDADLVVPHPHLLERAFALLPLLDVAPGAYSLAIDRTGVRETDLSLF